MAKKVQLSIDCELTFLPESEGGPSKGFWPKKFSGYVYRPCLVIGNIHQRQAKLISKDIEVDLDDGTKTTIRSDRFIDEEYLGVAFITGPDNPKIGERFCATFIPIAQDAPENMKFQSGVTFTVREGARIVGYGKVIHRYADSI